MVQVTCSESGITFEANSKRTKQHPDIATLKAEGNKKGTYRQVNEALSAVRKAGGYKTIDAFMALVRDHMTGSVIRRNEIRWDRAAAEEKARREVKERRQRENDLLKANGYQWKVEYVDRDAHPLEWRDEGKYFYLLDPDGHEIAKSQALAEIERGRDVVRSEITEHEAQKRQQAAEAKAQQQSQDEANRKALAALDAQIVEIKKSAQRVERFEFEGFEKVAESNVTGSTYHRFLDHIKRGQINGVTCYVLVTGSGLDDFGHYTYYSDNPAAAGLTVISRAADRGGLESTMRKYFGND